METYQEFKKRQADEFGKIEYLFWAFNDTQINEGLTKIGLNRENYVGKIISIGMGGYILKDKLSDFNSFLKKQKNERKEFRKNEENLIDAIVYEMNNHEYCITYDILDTIMALDLDVDRDKAIIEKARKKWHKLNNK
jgi:hypothetical protein